MSRKHKDGIPEVAETLKSAVSLWGIPMIVLRRAKGEGCSAFRGARVYRTPLMAWLKMNPDVAGEGEANEDKAALEKRKLMAQVHQLEFKLEKERGVVIPKSEAKDEWARAMAIVQEEAKSLMDKSYFKVFSERINSRIGEVLP